MSKQAASTTNRFLQIFSGPFGALLTLAYAGIITYFLTLDPRSLLWRLRLFSALALIYFIPQRPIVKLLLALRLC